jgi:hypothetical protein
MTTPSEDPTPRRRVLPIALLILATIIGITSVLALWVKRQALETDTWVDTSTELLEDEAISDAVGSFIVTTIFDNVDVEGEVAGALPPQAAPLAGPVASGVRQLATGVTQEALSRPRVLALWEDANRIAHERLIALLDDKGEFVSTTGGDVTLDLSQIVGEVAAAIGISADVASRIPPEAAQIEVMQSDELDAAQTGVKILRTLAWVLTALTLVLYGVAIYLARGRRRETLRAVGFSFITIGAVALIARSAGGSAVTDALSKVATADTAVLNTWDIGTSLLEDTGQSIVIYGVVAVLAAWLAGPSSIATSIRFALAPYLRQPRIAYSALAVILVLLFWWNPVVATDRLVPSLVLVVVLAIGVEALRRQIIREFPDRVVTGTPEGVAQALAGRMREARERRVTAQRQPGARAATGPPAAEPSRVEELERLAKLRESGVITDEELAAEKQRILSG